MQRWRSRDFPSLDSNRGLPMPNCQCQDCGKLFAYQSADIYTAPRCHKIVVGDATDPACVQRVLGRAKPFLMVVDQPFGVDYDAAWRQEAAEAGHLAYAARRIGKVANDDRADWREAWKLFPGDVVYCWHAGKHASQVQARIEAAGFEIRSQMIWSKPHFPISRGRHHWRHQPTW